MKTCVGNEQTRCRVACVEESFVLDFLFLFDQAKRKTHSFFTTPSGAHPQGDNPFVELL